MGDVPRSKIFDDIYFSAEDGRAETKYVFLDGNNLPARFLEKENFVICETGFGTGLNFLMAWEAFVKSGSRGTLHFISFEKYPLGKKDIDDALSSYFPSEFLWSFLAGYPYTCEGVSQSNYDDRQVRLTIYFDDVNDMIPEMDSEVDAWFLDGFAPAKNPGMWSETLFSNMARLSHGKTTFATFTAAGIVRRGLEAAGFEVLKTKGFGRKRDMIKGKYIGK